MIALPPPARASRLRRTSPPTRPGWALVRETLLPALLRFEPEDLGALLTPAAASAFLDVVALGGLERAARSPDSDALLRLRGDLARIAASPDRSSSVGCVVSDGTTWVPLSMTGTASPWAAGQALTLVLDEGRQRTDGVAVHVSALMSALAPHADRLHVVRTRTGGSRAPLPPSWRFALKACWHALQEARRGSRLPRWAALGHDGSTASLDTLPPDVRVAALRRGAATPKGMDGWVVAPGLPGQARDRYLEGRPVCFVVDRAEDAGRCVAGLSASA